MPIPNQMYQPYNQQTMYGQYNSYYPYQYQQPRYDLQQNQPLFNQQQSIQPQQQAGLNGKVVQAYCERCTYGRLSCRIPKARHVRDLYKIMECRWNH